MSKICHYGVLPFSQNAQLCQSGIHLILNVGTLLVPCLQKHFLHPLFEGYSTFAVALPHTSLGESHWKCWVPLKKGCRKCFCKDGTSKVPTFKIRCMPVWHTPELECRDLTGTMFAKTFSAPLFEGCSTFSVVFPHTNARCAGNEIKI